MRPVRIHHLAFRTGDLPRLRAFYVDVLGFAVDRERDGSVWLVAGGASRLMLEARLPGEPSIAEGSMEFVAFAIDGAERRAFVDRLALLGVPIEASTPSTIYFRDPEGRRIGLSSYEFTSPERSS